MIQTVENHPMAAGFNNISVSMLCIHKSNDVLFKCVIQSLTARGNSRPPIISEYQILYCIFFNIIRSFK